MFSSNFKVFHLPEFKEATYDQRAKQKSQFSKGKRHGFMQCRLKTDPCRQGGKGVISWGWDSSEIPRENSQVEKQQVLSKFGTQVYAWGLERKTHATFVYKRLDTSVIGTKGWHGGGRLNRHLVIPENEHLHGPRKGHWHSHLYGRSQDGAC